MLHKTAGATLLALFFCLPAFSQNDDTTSSINMDSLLAEVSNYLREAHVKDSLLDYEHGDIIIEDGLATLHLGTDYKYLRPRETSKVLVDAWGNPPQKTLGMIFPDSANPYTYSGWGIVISYAEEGYVEDEDAQDIDYDEMLDDLQKSAIEYSKTLREQGYSGYEVAGWAEDPFYDSENKKLYWAKNLKFENTEENTLNYDIRVLGRKGYLELGAVANISQLDEVKTGMQALLPNVEFNPGNTYFDFDPGVDKVAAYGIGALVAGKIIAKVGLLKVIGIFLAKFWKFILIGIAGLFTVIKKFFGGKSKMAPQAKPAEAVEAKEEEDETKIES